MECEFDPCYLSVAKYSHSFWAIDKPVWPFYLKLWSLSYRTMPLPLAHERITLEILLQLRTSRTQKFKPWVCSTFFSTTMPVHLQFWRPKVTRRSWNERQFRTNWFPWQTRSPIPSSVFRSDTSGLRLFWADCQRMNLTLWVRPWFLTPPSSSSKIPPLPFWHFPLFICFRLNYRESPPPSACSHSFNWIFQAPSLLMCRPFPCLASKEEIQICSLKETSGSWGSLLCHGEFLIFFAVNLISTVTVCFNRLW